VRCSSPLLASLRVTIRSRLELAAEILALWHQLAVLQRAAPKRPRLRSLDRLHWVLLSIVWPNWRQAVQIVTPATVVRWHRRAFAAYWRWNSRSRRIGRPALASDLRVLIRRMREANPTLGSAPHPPRARSPRGANRKTIRVTLQAAAKSPMTAGWRFESLHEWPSIISSSGVHRPMRRYARRRFPRAEPFGDARGLGRNTMRARRLPKLPVVRQNKTSRQLFGSAVNRDRAHQRTYRTVGRARAIGHADRRTRPGDAVGRVRRQTLTPRLRSHAE